MIIPRLRLSASRSLFAIVATSAVLGAVSVASAAPTLLSPATGSTVKTVRVTTQYSPAMGETMSGLEFSTSAALDGAGAFSHTTAFTEYTGIDSLAGTTLHTNTVAEQLHAGTWFWHAASIDGGAATQWSTINSFVIPPVVGINRLTAFPSHRGIDGRIKISSNFVTPGLRVRVVIGKKQCMNKTYALTGASALTRSEINVPLAFTYTCHPGRRLAKGTRIKVALTVSGGAAHKSQVKVVHV